MVMMTMTMMMVMTPARRVTTSCGFARSILCTCGQTGRLHQEEDGDDGDDDDDGDGDDSARLRQVHFVYLRTDKKTSP